MKTHHQFLFFLILTCFLMGCSENPHHFKTKDIMMKTASQEADKIKNDLGLDSKEKAKKLVKIGELLMETPRGIELSVEPFESALSFDKENAHANFYLAFLKPILVLKGSPKRLSKLVGDTDLEKGLNYIVKGIRTPDVQILVRGLMDGDGKEKPFDTISELQDFLLKTFLPELEKSIERLTQIEKNDSFLATLNISLWTKKPLQKIISFDLAEVRGLKVSLTAISAWVKCLVAYDLDAATSIKNQLSKKHRNTFKEVVDIIRTYPKALVLRQNGDKRLKEILTHAADVIEGLRTIAKILNKIPRDETRIFDPFPNSEEFGKFMKGLGTAADVLAGPILVKIGKQERAAVLINATALFAEPHPDLKNILPTEFDKTGKLAKSFPDLSFGGVIPEKNLISEYCVMEPEKRKIRLPVKCP